MCKCRTCCHFCFRTGYIGCDIWGSYGYLGPGTGPLGVSLSGSSEVRNSMIFSNLLLSDYTVVANEQLQKRFCAKFSFQELDSDRYFILQIILLIILTAWSTIHFFSDISIEFVLLITSQIRIRHVVQNIGIPARFGCNKIQEKLGFLLQGQSFDAQQGIVFGVPNDNPPTLFSFRGEKQRNDRASNIRSYHFCAFQLKK